MMAALIAPMEMPGDPVRVQVGLGQRLVDAALVGAERAAALQEQGDAFEVGAFAPHIGGAAQPAA